MSTLLSRKNRVVVAWVAEVDGEIMDVWLEKQDAERYADRYNAWKTNEMSRAKVRRFRGEVAKGGAA